MVIDFWLKTNYNGNMKVTEITTITGKTITVSKEQGDIIRQGIFNQTPFVAIDKANGHIVRTSTIAEVKDVWAKDPNQKVLNTGDPKDNRASTDSDAYKKFQEKKAQLFGK
jgi:hypothetical protein|nr:MAG TPA: hypothetical protein [Caudoviricetes sp.]